MNAHAAVAGTPDRDIRADARAPEQRKPRQFSLKRAIDRSAAAVTIACGAPFGALVAAAIRLESPGGALYRQKRVGQNGAHFDVYKFRTMVEHAPVQFNADGSTFIGKRDARITKLGALLRGGLDELPQLLNVLRGEMSLVGPRPDMVEHESMYTWEERRKLCVPPGITSLAAVLGRNRIPWKTRIQIDLRYVDAWSLALDLKIVIATLCLPLGIRPFRFDSIIGDLLDDHRAD